MLSSLGSSSAAAPATEAPLAALDTNAIAAADTGQGTNNNPVFAELFAGERLEESAGDGTEGRAELLPDVTPETVTTDTQAAPELDAEQWLQQALDQQQVQLQVRDAPTPSGDAQAAVANNSRNAAWLPFGAAGVAQPGARGMNTQVVSTSGDQAREPSMPANPTLTLWANRTATESLPANQPQGFVATQGVSEAAQQSMPQSTQQSILQSAQQSTQQSVSHLVPQGTDASLVDSTLLATSTADSLSPVADRASSTLSNSIINLGDKTVQDSSLQAAAKGLAPEAKWGEQLLHTLRDQVQVQIQQRIQNATIRLDPPELGSLEIFLSHEAGRLTVHINASQADVARLLQHTSDRLRQELAGGQFTQVNVQTNSEGQSGQQHSRHGAQGLMVEEMIQVNGQPRVDDSRAQGSQASDVLITV
ncbi:MAG TPA: flagellar hook-length control protein FliK [Cellvibrio sp.]